jgi:hypothetical protein
MQWRQQEMIPRLCAESSRWTVVSREVDAYQVRNDDGRRPVYIRVNQSRGATTTHFQAFFPIRFSLEREPPGLFARILLRNFHLKLATWGMFIGGSCEACLYLAAQVPTAGLDAAWFDFICEEILAEMNSLQDELHAKFSYQVAAPGNDPGYPVGQREEVAPRDSLMGPRRYQLPQS